MRPSPFIYAFGLSQDPCYLPKGVEKNGRGQLPISWTSHKVKEEKSYQTITVALFKNQVIMKSNSSYFYKKAKAFGVCHITARSVNTTQ